MDKLEQRKGQIIADIQAIHDMLENHADRDMLEPIHEVEIRLLENELMIINNTLDANENS